jgi:hypothetical protein
MTKKRRKKVRKPKSMQTRDPWGNLRPDIQHLQNQISSLAKRVEDIERLVPTLSAFEHALRGMKPNV